MSHAISRMIENNKNSKKQKYMTKDSIGHKFNRIPGYTKVVNGKEIEVKPHVRSNRKDSKGK